MALVVQAEQRKLVASALITEINELIRNKCLNVNDSCSYRYISLRSSGGLPKIFKVLSFVNRNIGAKQFVKLYICDNTI